MMKNLQDLIEEDKNHIVLYALFIIGFAKFL